MSSGLLWFLGDHGRAYSKLMRMKAAVATPEYATAFFPYDRSQGRGSDYVIAARVNQYIVWVWLTCHM